jgi:aspartyl-tRNA(Asn)/glutamyl-tRNA(Gln) amidotransferase subunit A
MGAIADLTCADLTAAYRRGALSPVEVARDCLARIDAQHHLNAFMPLDPERTLAAASESEKRWKAGTPLGAIDGIPTTVKDNVGARTKRWAGDRAPARAGRRHPR